METKRIFLAAFLIIVVWFLWNSLFSPVGGSAVATGASLQKTEEAEILSEADFQLNAPSFSNNKYEEILTEVETDLFRATLTSKNGGSFLGYELLGHRGSYDNKNKTVWGGVGYSSDISTSLIYGQDDGFGEGSLFCNPCVESLGLLVTDVAVSSSLEGVFPFIINYTLLSNKDTLGHHIITIEKDSYLVNHKYKIKRPNSKYSVAWKNGIRPAERYYWLDDQYSYAMYANKNGDSDYLTGNKNIDKMSSLGEVEWAGVRNLFFVSALVPRSENVGAEFFPIQDTFVQSAWVGGDGYGRPDFPSVYDFKVDFIVDSSSEIEFDTFIAPLDYSLIKGSNIKNLDWIMTLGGSILRPISKFIINTIQFLQNTFPFLGVGVVLILFAFLVRIVSGPLTKMSLRSTQKMQEIQPIIKKIQDQYKSDPKAMQMKIMQTYKEHNVNPLSGCLLMFLQWPIMIPPFIVFRSVVDFRGESFLWIKDLSEPDYLVSLPFHIPLLGTGEGWTGIGILPILMGITLFLTMKKTMANIEGQNKIMMYGMNGMFIILFNGFPAALNLYYVVYNLLNYLQQRKKDGGSPSIFSKIKGFLKNQKK